MKLNSRPRGQDMYIMELVQRQCLGVCLGVTDSKHGCQKSGKSLQWYSVKIDLRKENLISSPPPPIETDCILLILAMNWTWTSVFTIVLCLMAWNVGILATVSIRIWKRKLFLN